MNAVDEIQTQREAILKGKWVRGTPRRPGEACLLYRQETETTRIYIFHAERYVRAAILEMHRERMFRLLAPTAWNDTIASLSDVMAVLDRAEILAKEDGVEV